MRSFPTPAIHRSPSRGRPQACLKGRAPCSVSAAHLSRRSIGPLQDEGARNAGAREMKSQKLLPGFIPQVRSNDVSRQSRPPLGCWKAAHRQRCAKRLAERSALQHQMVQTFRTKRVAFHRDCFAPPETTDFNPNAKTESPRLGPAHSGQASTTRRCFFFSSTRSTWLRSWPRFRIMPPAATTQ